MFNFKKQVIKNLKNKKNLNGKTHNKFSQKDIDELIKLMSKSSKPIFYTGGGVINSGPKASELLRELVRCNRFSNYFNITRSWIFSRR